MIINVIARENETEDESDELRSEIKLPVDENIQDLEPETPVIEPEEEIFEDASNMRDTTRKKKTRRKETTRPQSRTISQLHNELRKHSESRKKTDLAVRGIEKQLKDLLLAHHSAIRDLQKQLLQIRRKIATIQSPKKFKTTGTKTKIITRKNP
jgi:hypothetical protein